MFGGQGVQIGGENIENGNNLNVVGGPGEPLNQPNVVQDGDLNQMNAV